MELRVKLKMDNAAFWENPGEASRILRTLAEKVEDSEDEGGDLRDINGNKVGTWTLDENG